MPVFCCIAARSICIAQVLFSFSDTDAIRKVLRVCLPYHEYILPLCDQNSSTRQIETFSEVSCGGTGYEIAEMNGGAGKRDEMATGQKSIYNVY